MGPGDKKDVFVEPSGKADEVTFTVGEQVKVKGVAFQIYEINRKTGTIILLPWALAIREKQERERRGEANRKKGKWGFLGG